MQPLDISPLLIVLGGAVTVLVVGVFLPRPRQTAMAGLSVAVLLAAAAAAVGKLDAPPGYVIEATYVFDRPGIWSVLILLGAGVAAILLSVPTFRGDAREGEYYALLLFSILGAALLAGANDLMEIMLAVLLTAVPSYAMVAYRRTSPPALEALLKYYLFGALTNIGLIYGLVLLYGMTGTTSLHELGPALTDASRPMLAVAAALVVVGLGFKSGHVPAHFWIPDVYHGTTVPVAAYLSVVPKIAAVLALARLTAVFVPAVPGWSTLVGIVAAVTMTWGNVAALVQRDLRRLLAYSTIAQAGYLLLGVVALEGSPRAADALVYYFAAYAAANLGAFAVLGALGRYDIEVNRSLIRTAPWLALAMLVSLLSLLGLPPLAGFVGKFLLFSATWEAGYPWLTALALVNSALSLFYYLRVVAPMFVPPAGALAYEIEALPQAVAVASAAATLAIGVGAWMLPSGLRIGG